MGVYFTYVGVKTPLGGLSPNFLEEDTCDVITCFKFGDDRFRGLASAEDQILPFSIDFDGPPYNTLKVRCDHVIYYVKLKKMACLEKPPKSAKLQWGWTTSLPDYK